jgi:hypothetical protein
MSMRGCKCPSLRGPALALTALALAGCGQADVTGGGEARAVAARFLDDVRAGRYEVAWQGTSTEFKSLMGVENLRDYVKSHPALRSPAEHVESRATVRGGHSMTDSVFRATPLARRGKKSVRATIRVLLAPEGEAWKVEKLSVE